MRGFAVWFTGLPCSGKTTLAQRLKDRLDALEVKAILLDGDEVRRHLSRGLGFSREDRDENVRRIGYVAGLVAECGAAAIVSAVSPYRAVRDEVRRAIGRFMEVHVDCPVEICIRRDVKGMYRRALAGELPHFTGVSDPYEPPLAPELVVRTAEASVEECVDGILRRLHGLGLLETIPERSR